MAISSETEEPTKKKKKRKSLKVKKSNIQKIEEHLKTPPEIPKEEQKQVQYTSTGSTLLDLIISGNVVRGGGIPSGIVVEIYGPSAAGKTALLCEIAAGVQSKNGIVQYLDPEGRLNSAYTAIYGASIDEKLYSRPDTVEDMFETLNKWEPENETVINLIAADSLAALSTKMEMEGEDKMGMRRAKKFSEGFRKEARRLSVPHKLLVCSNQEREGGTPGGKAIGYYSSIRIRICPEFKGSKIEESKKIRGKSHKKLIGIKSKCKVTKSSVDHPYREAPICIIFDYGIDDIRANLQYYKDNTESTKYVVGEHEFGIMKKAIQFVEDNNLEHVLKEQVIDLWEEIENEFRVKRVRKQR